MSHTKTRLCYIKLVIIIVLMMSSSSIIFAQKQTNKNLLNNPPVTENVKEQSPEEKPSEFEQLLDKELGTDTEKPGNKEIESTNWVFQIIKTILGLAFVIIIILIFQKFLKYKNKFITSDTHLIKILHEYPIESGKKLQIIEVANKLLLIGVSDAGIQLVSEFKEQVFIDQIKLTCETFKQTEKPDLWLDLTTVISNKVQDIFNKKNKNMDNIDHSKWNNLQSNARLKINELRDKKKLFEDMDDSNEQ
ncbi:MAG: flagellar biosynthetic protein FliO [Spirochaetia bacterium]|nr:flagellar biosynthetic protein FliO [Spirochaetia bacterium]